MPQQSTTFRPPQPWVITWMILYAVILIVGLTAAQSPILTIIKVSSVLLCSIYTLVVFPHDRLLQAAMIITFIADCILAKNNVSPTGLIVFFCAQLVHLYRQVELDQRQHVLRYAAIGMLIIGINFIIRLIPAVFIIAGFYACTLIGNIIVAYRQYRRKPLNFFARAAFYGFVLFACCDLCTVISYFSLIDLLPTALYAPANFFAWFFYYPSQILVSNSSKCAIIGLKEGKC